MKRTALALEDGIEIGEITCESYGYTMDAKQVWWIPETKKKYLYTDLGDFAYFELYDGPVIHGTGYSF